MKISIEIRKPDTEGKRAIRLIYYGGSYTDPETGKRRHKRSRESLDLFLYDKPRTPAQRHHNKEAERAAEAIRAKRLYEYETGKHGLGGSNQLKASFFDYFQSITDEKAEGSQSNHSVWVSTLKHLKVFHKLPDLTFEEVDQTFLERFRHYLIHTARTKSSSPLSSNTQSAYFNKVRAALNQAEQQGLIHDNPVRRVKAIKPENNKRVYLTEEELRALAKAECRYEVLKRAFLFSACTGLRWSDVQKLTWREVERFYDGYRVVFRQKKTKGLQYLDVNKTAVSLMGHPSDPQERVFKGLKYSSWHNMELMRWAMAAGITKKITFHSARHTFAVIQLSRGVDIYSVSRLLGHSELRTTEIYADIIETKQREAMIQFPDVLSEPLPSSGY
ncbi:site-specific integrase [Marinobacter sp. EVN1]|uniref:site-specific integrase n=1 Tax=Marinobacter sp. EVN1 TaxID=1397532 RepID=UPI0004CE9171|nr:site-specific integrase [Marinobacter sp. EVN1]